MSFDFLRAEDQQQPQQPQPQQGATGQTQPQPGATGPTQRPAEPPPTEMQRLVVLTGDVLARGIQELLKPGNKERLEAFLAELEGKTLTDQEQELARAVRTAVDERMRRSQDDAEMKELALVLGRIDCQGELVGPKGAGEELPAGPAQPELGKAAGKVKGAGDAFGAKEESGDPAVPGGVKVDPETLPRFDGAKVGGQTAASGPQGVLLASAKLFGAKGVEDAVMAAVVARTAKDAGGKPRVDPKIASLSPAPPKPEAMGATVPASVRQAAPALMQAMAAAAGPMVQAVQGAVRALSGAVQPLRSKAEAEGRQPKSTPEAERKKLLELVSAGRNGDVEAIQAQLKAMGPAARGALPDLVKLAQGGDLFVRGWAAVAIRSIGGTDAAAVDAYAAMLRSPDSLVRFNGAMAVAEAVERAGLDSLDGKSLGLLIETLGAAARDLRNARTASTPEAAARALALLGPRAVPALIEAAGPPRSGPSQADVVALRASHAARRALESMGEAAVPDLLAALGDKRAEVRSAAAEVLAARGPDIAPELFKRLGRQAGADQAITELALRAPAEKIAPLLIHKLSDKDPLARTAAAHALGWMGDNLQGGLRGQVAAALRPGLAAADSSERLVFAEALYRLTSDAAAVLPAVLPMASSKDERDRGAAASLLAKALMIDDAGRRDEALAALRRMGPAGIPALQEVIRQGGHAEALAAVRELARSARDDVAYIAPLTEPAALSRLRPEELADLHARLADLEKSPGPGARHDQILAARRAVVAAFLDRRSSAPDRGPADEIRALEQDISRASRELGLRGDDKALTPLKQSKDRIALEALQREWGSQGLPLAALLGRSDEEMAGLLQGQDAGALLRRLEAARTRGLQLGMDPGFELGVNLEAAIVQAEAVKVLDDLTKVSGGLDAGNPRARAVLDRLGVSEILGPAAPPILFRGMVYRNDGKGGIEAVKAEAFDKEARRYQRLLDEVRDRGFSVDPKSFRLTLGQDKRLRVGDLAGDGEVARTLREALDLFHPGLAKQLADPERKQFVLAGDQVYLPPDSGGNVRAVPLDRLAGDEAFQRPHVEFLQRLQGDLSKTALENLGGSWMGQGKTLVNGWQTLRSMVGASADFDGLMKKVPESNAAIADLGNRFRNGEFAGKPKEFADAYNAALAKLNAAGKANNDFIKVRHGNFRTSQMIAGGLATAPAAPISVPFMIVATPFASASVTLGSGGSVKDAAHDAAINTLAAVTFTKVAPAAAGPLKATIGPFLAKGGASVLGGSAASVVAYTADQATEGRPPTLQGLREAAGNPWVVGLSFAGAYVPGPNGRSMFGKSGPAGPGAAAPTVTTDLAALGLKPGATPAQIRDAWAARVKATHPDMRFGDTSKVAEYQAAVEAYGRLSKLSEAQLAQAGAGGPSGSWSRLWDGVKSWWSGGALPAPTEVPALPAGQRPRLLGYDAPVKTPPPPAAAPASAPVPTQQAVVDLVSELAPRFQKAVNNVLEMNPANPSTCEACGPASIAAVKPLTQALQARFGPSVEALPVLGNFTNVPGQAPRHMLVEIVQRTGPLTVERLALVDFTAAQQPRNLNALQLKPGDTVVLPWDKVQAYPFKPDRTPGAAADIARITKNFEALPNGGTNRLMRELFKLVGPEPAPPAGGGADLQGRQPVLRSLERDFGGQVALQDELLKPGQKVRLPGNVAGQVERSPEGVLRIRPDSGGPPRPLSEATRLHDAPMRVETLPDGTKVGVLYRAVGLEDIPPHQVDQFVRDIRAKGLDSAGRAAFQGDEAALKARMRQLSSSDPNDLFRQLELQWDSALLDPATGKSISMFQSFTSDARLARGWTGDNKIVVEVRVPLDRILQAPDMDSLRGAIEAGRARGKDFVHFPLDRYESEYTTLGMTVPPGQISAIYLPPRYSRGAQPSSK